MIVRTWKATATPEGAEKYCEYFEQAVLPKLQELDGFRGAYVLCEPAGEVVLIEDLTFWDSLTSIRAFAGDYLETAVVDPPAQAILLDFDIEATHRTIAVTAHPS
jgi:heme-degrading monooxygenase HmoA